MVYLTKEDIIYINRRTVERHGGNYVQPNNFLNENPLDYLIEVVQAEMYGSPLYPKISDKAGVYFYNIIDNHVFQDGNKRTGLEAALAFLKLNGYRLSKILKPLVIEERFIPDSGVNNTEILINFVIEVASGVVSLEESQNWFELNIVKTKSSYALAA